MNCFLIQAERVRYTSSVNLFSNTMLIIWVLFFSLCWFQLFVSLIFRIVVSNLMTCEIRKLKKKCNTVKLTSSRNNVSVKLTTKMGLFFSLFFCIRKKNEVVAYLLVKSSTFLFS